VAGYDFGRFASRFGVWTLGSSGAEAVVGKQAGPKIRMGVSFIFIISVSYAPFSTMCIRVLYRAGSWTQRHCGGCYGVAIFLGLASGLPVEKEKVDTLNDL
jgi:hypothetical protein